MTSRIVGLSDGSMSLIPKNGYPMPDGAMTGLSSPAAAPSKKYRAAPARRVSRAVLAPTYPDYVEALGDSLERLASMTLARKMSSPAPLTTVECSEMAALAGVPNTRAGQMLTEQILAASVDELGKGDIIGSIGKAATQVVTQVVRPAVQVVQKMAPALAAVPVIGPIIAPAVQMGASMTESMTHGGINAVTKGGFAGVLQTLGGAGGAAIGTAISTVGGVGQGAGQAVGLVAQGAMAAGTYIADGVSTIGGDMYSYLSGASSSGGGMLSSIMSAGRGMINSFDSSVMSAIESTNPSLSGELTSIFHGLGEEYQSFASTFDGWSASMKSAIPGTVMTGKLNGNLFTMVKDAAGRMNVTKTPVVNAPAAVNTIRDGALMSPQQLGGLGVPAPVGGSQYPTGSNGMGQGISAAGISLPGGPVNPYTDQTSQRIIQQAINKENAGKSPAMPQLAGVPMWAVAGLGVAALYAVLQGRSAASGPMMPMGQGWSRPVRNKPRRKSKRRK